jgi:hypothetical protein
LQDRNQDSKMGGGRHMVCRPDRVHGVVVMSREIMVGWFVTEKL